MSSYNDDNGNGKKPPGRPPTYKPEYAAQAYVLCKNHGVTMEELGEALGKTFHAVYDWIEAYPKFAEAITTGIDEWRNRRVEDTLMQRALGYEYEEISVEEMYIYTGDDAIGKKRVPGEKVKRTIRHVQPSDTAIIFWLKNRDNERWKDVREYEGRFSKREISLRLQADLKVEDLKQLGVKQLEQLAGIIGQLEFSATSGDSGEGAGREVSPALH